MGRKGKEAVKPSAGRQEIGQILLRHRSTEVVSLHFETLLPDEKVHLGPGLDPFRHNGKTEIPTLAPRKTSFSSSRKGDANR